MIKLWSKSKAKVREVTQVDAAIATINSLAIKFKNNKTELASIRSTTSDLPAALDQLDKAWEEYSNEFAYRPKEHDYSKLSNKVLAALESLKAGINGSFEKYIKKVESQILILGEGDLRHTSGGAAESTADILTKLQSNLQRLAEEKHLKQLSKECINLNSIANRLHTRIDAVINTKDTINSDVDSGMPKVRDLRNSLIQNMAELISEVGAKEKIHPSVIINLKQLISTNPAAGNNSLMNILTHLDTELTNLQPDYDEIKKLSDQANSLEKSLIQNNRVNDDDDDSHKTTIETLNKLANIKLPTESGSIHTTMNQLNNLLKDLSTARDSNEFRNNYSSAIASVDKILIRLKKLLSEELNTMDNVSDELDKLMNSTRTNGYYGSDPSTINSGLQNDIKNMYDAPNTLVNLIKNERIHVHAIRELINNDLVEVEHIIDDSIVEIRNAHAYDGSSQDDGTHQNSLNDFKKGWNQILAAVKAFETKLNEFQNELNSFIRELTHTIRHMKGSSYQKEGLSTDQQNQLVEIDRDMTTIVKRLSDTAANGFGNQLYR